MPEFSRYLVTGGAGFIGSNFVHHLLSERPEARVVTLDALTYAGHRANLAGLPDAERHTFVEGDIRDADLLARLFAEHQFDAVAHFAAESHVDRSIEGPGAFVDTNVVGTLRLLEAAREAWAQDGSFDADRVRFHHVSTDEVYGTLEPGDPAFAETTPYAPRSPYAASKASSDHLVRAYDHTYGLPVTLTNCSNNYGPRQYPEKLIPLVLVKALRGEPLPLYGDGQQIRDWLHVDDHARAILAVIERGEVGATYNVGGGNQPTNRALVETLCAILDDEVPASPHRPHAALITRVADRPGHDRRYAIDDAKLRGDLGWAPRYDLARGLRETVRWYLTHSGWLTEVTGDTAYADWLGRQYD